MVTGDQSKSKAWSRYAPDSTAYKEHEGFKDSEIQDEKRESVKKKKESKMQEYLHYTCILCVI